MARNKLNRKKKTGERLTKGIKIANLKNGYGPEPDWKGVKLTDADYDAKFGNALTWANMAFEPKKHRANFNAWAVKNGLKLSQLKEIPDYRFSHVGKIAWLINSGAPLRKDVKDRFLANVEQLKLFVAIDEAKGFEEVADPMAEARMIAGLAAEFEALAKEDGVDRIREILFNHQVPAVVSEAVAAKLKAMSKDWIAVADDVVDGVAVDARKRAFAKRAAVRIDSAAAVVAEQAGRARKAGPVRRAARVVDADGKTVRKARAKKVVTVEQATAKLKFKVRDPKTDLVSIKPADVVGAKRLVIYDTSRRLVGVYVAKDRSGLQIKRTKILNFDPKASVAKRLRKPLKQLDGVKTNSVRKFNKWFEEIKAKAYNLRSATNEHTVLVKTLKEGAE